MTQMLEKIKWYLTFNKMDIRNNQVLFWPFILYKDAPGSALFYICLLPEQQQQKILRTSQVKNAKLIRQCKNASGV